MLDFEGIGQFHDLQLSERSDSFSKPLKNSPEKLSGFILESLTSFWHVPIGRETRETESERYGSPPSENWKIVGSPPGRSGGFFRKPDVESRAPRSEPRTIDIPHSSSLFGSAPHDFQLEHSLAQPISARKNVEGRPTWDSDMFLMERHHSWDESCNVQWRTPASPVGSPPDVYSSSYPETMSADGFLFSDHMGGQDFSQDGSLSKSSRKKSSSKTSLNKGNVKKSSEKTSEPELVPTSTCSYFRVEFKSGRSGVYFAEENDAATAGLKMGELVLVEADRGKDLGKITHIEAADKDAKAIVRVAQPTEVNQMPLKVQDEAKALTLCQTKIRQKKLPMEVIDAEYQWDRKKLTYFFVADRRIDFRELVRELFKIYKTRIWMCSVEEKLQRKS